jgi:hypothetical protein
MSLIHNSKHKLRNIQRTIDGILNGDMPFSAGRKALVRLSEAFTAFEKKLDRAIKLKDDANISSLANNINVKILEVLPILGFILRSTNVRNAFELIEPLQALANLAMQGKPELILSSEWDYIPFAYPQSLDDLKSYVLIGLPASEAASALLVPIAGHELGHAVWRNRGLSSDIQLTLDAHLDGLFHANLPNFRKIFTDYDPNDVFKRELLSDSKSQALEYAEFQAEEIFCDLFGYALFGASYLHAFAFILAPSVGGRYRSGKYPTYSKRISIITDVAAKEGVKLPDHTELKFARDLRGFDDRHRFIIKMADESAAVIAPALWKKVVTVIDENSMRRPLKDNAVRHLADLRLGIPPSKPECLGDILNAGWLRYEEIVRSQTANDASDELDQLNEVLLKTVEVLEFRRRTS